MKVGMKKVLKVLGAVAVPVGMSAIAYCLGLRKGENDTRNGCNKVCNSLSEEIDEYYCRLGNLTDKVNEFSKKTSIDITKDLVVLENEDVLGTLAKEAIQEHGFGLDGARNYNFKIISIAQKSDD